MNDRLAAEPNSTRRAPGWRLRTILPGSSRDLVDWGAAAGLMVLAQVQLVLFTHWRGDRARWMGLALLLTLLQTLPLGLRRRAAVEVLLLVCGGALTQLHLGIPGSDFGTFGVLVAFYTAVARSSRWQAIGMALLAAVGIFIVNDLDHFVSMQPDGLFLVYVQFLAAWVLGSSARHRRQRIADLQDHTRRVELEWKARARQALADERARIGRELHDVISHSLGVVLVQAGAARCVVDSAPDSARACLASIETVGSETLTEVRRLLRLVRDEDELDTGPRPGLHALPSLVRRLEAAGLTVDLRITGEPRPLPASADLSAYRILQEALTNTLKHAGPVPVRVSIRYTAQVIDLEVTDGGPAPDFAPSPRTDAGPGHGLLGMRERVRLFGGELSAGPDGRGFTVTACLPLRSPGAGES